MKTWILLPLILFTSTAKAETLGEIAFERLASEITVAADPGSKAESVGAYFDVLDRVGEKPKSASRCLKAVSSGSSLGSCFPLAVSARSGGGTGGVD